MTESAPRRGRGRPAIGPQRNIRIPDETWDVVRRLLRAPNIASNFHALRAAAGGLARAMSASCARTVARGVRSWWEESATNSRCAPSSVATAIQPPASAPASRATRSRSGRNAPMAKTMLVPEAWSKATTDMPKAWFVALASLSKSATPKRVRQNANADHVVVPPVARKTRLK